MAKTTVALFLLGVAIAVWLAVSQYSSAPQGTLLYTPAPGVELHYSSSSCLGFLLGVFALSALSAFVAVICFIGSTFLDQRLLLKMTKQAGLLFVGYGLLFMFAGLTEKFWP